MNSKLSVFNSNFILVLVYAAESWMTRKEKKENQTHLKQVSAEDPVHKI